MTNFNSVIAFTSGDIGDMSIAIECFPGCDVINFENNLSFSIKLFFHLTKKSRQKFNILRTKRVFKVK